MDDEKIVLDKKTFKALAADSRIDILKELSKQRKTQSELADNIGLSVATIKEHLDKMSDANLLKQKDEGRKWKYYELTEKGRCVLHPERKKIWVVLIALFFVAGFVIFTTFGSLFQLIPSQQMYTMCSSVENTNIAVLDAVESSRVSSNMATTVMDDGMIEESGSIEKTIAPSSLPNQNYNNDLHEVKLSLLQYITYGMLLLLIFLFIYYMSNYDDKQEIKK